MLIHFSISLHRHSCLENKLGVIHQQQIKFWEQKADTFIYLDLKNVKSEVIFSPDSLMEMEMIKEKYSSVFEKKKEKSNFAAHQFYLPSYFFVMGEQGIKDCIRVSILKG